MSLTLVSTPRHAAARSVGGRARSNGPGAARVLFGPAGGAARWTFARGPHLGPLTALGLVAALGAVVLLGSPTTVTAQDPPARPTAEARAPGACDGPCRLTVRGGIRLLHLPPAVYAGTERVGWARPSEELRTLVVVDETTAEAYARFSRRSGVGQWMVRGALLGAAAYLLGSVQDEGWAAPVGLAAAALYTGAYLPEHMARASLTEAVEAHNQAVGRR